MTRYVLLYALTSFPVMHDHRDIVIKIIVDSGIRTFTIERIVHINAILTVTVTQNDIYSFFMPHQLGYKTCACGLLHTCIPYAHAKIMTTHCADGYLLCNKGLPSTW